jgi:hypothetical protein
MKLINDLNANNNFIRSGKDPLLPQDLATKAYVDSSVGGANALNGVLFTGLSNTNSSVSSVSAGLSNATGAVAAVSNNLSSVSTSLSAVSTNLSSVSAALSRVSTGLSNTNSSVSFLSSSLSSVSTGLSVVSSSLSTTESIVGQLNSAATAFSNSRWHYYDFDTSAGIPNFSVSNLNAGSSSFNIGFNNTYGISRIVSSVTANSGVAISCNQLVFLSTKLITRSVFYLESSQSTRIIRTGFTSTGAGWSAQEISGFYAQISNQTITAVVAKASVNNNQGLGTVLPINTVIVLDVEVLGLNSVRIVAFDLLTNNIYFDQVINIVLPVTGVFAMFKAISTGTTAAAMCVIDYIGTGLTRPSYIAAPAYAGNIG